MLLYLDNCCFNRPFDDQSRPRIRLETEAKIEIQRRIRDSHLELAWSYILDYENEANPLEERRLAIAKWRKLAVVDVGASEALREVAHRVAGSGIRAKDALHIACAVTARCDFFLTTDDLLLKKARTLDIIRVANPAEFIIEVD